MRYNSGDAARGTILSVYNKGSGGTTIALHFADIKYIYVPQIADTLVRIRIMRSPVVYVQNAEISRMSCSALLAAAIAILMIFCNSSPSAADNGDVTKYVIGPGDVIQIFVWQHEQFNGTMTVAPDGNVTVNMLGDIPVSGFTRQELEADITKRLTERFVREVPEVTVSIVEFRSQRISVFGAVTNPSTITFSTVPSLLEVVMAQCIPTPDADLTAVMIMPKLPSTRKTITVDLMEILNKGDISKLPRLHPGDTVYVPRVKPVAEETGTTETTDIDSATSTPPQPPGVEPQAGRFVVHVIGAVNRPSSYEFTEEPTLTEVLLRAESVSDHTALRYLRIIRKQGTTDDAVLDVDFAEYLADGDASRLPRLRSGDTVYIPDVTQERMTDISITITGEVLTPGTYRIYKPLNILDAISRAGGLTDDADTENIRIRKETADSYQEKVVDIDEYLRDVGSTTPPEVVEQGCSIHVPEQRSSSSVVATVARGVVAFVADLAMVYSFWRVVGD
jgi:polysaccharide export outer membrane protein